jgi:hypothetical protein
MALPLPSLAWDTPARGTQTRSALMDAIRPHAEWRLGAPLVFRVDDLRVSGSVAFGNLYAIRPDGSEITRAQIPSRPGWDNPLDWDGPQIQVLYQRSGNTWVAVHHDIGATDVWWAAPVFCGQWRAVVPEFC